MTKRSPLPQPQLGGLEGNIHEALAHASDYCALLDIKGGVIVQAT